MNIRSITALIDVTYPLKAETIARAGNLLRAACEALIEGGYAVQTRRLATHPFPAVLEEAGPGKALDLAKDLEALAFVHEIDYIGLGPVRLGDPPAFIGAIPDVFAGTDNVFASVEIASQAQGVSLPQLRRAAGAVQRTAALSGDGFANLYLAALANVPPGAPFFPAAYHRGGDLTFAIATESANLAVEAVTSATSLAGAREALIHAVEVNAERIASIARRVAGRFDVAFGGIDFSLAPYPEEMRSVGRALEQLGVPAFGGQGSLAAAAFLTDALDRADFKRAGFCGLMLPVLEDSILALRARDGLLRLTDLLTFSAVCGTGLDTIPLPGDITQQEIAAILLDVAVLSLRLNKPLTARLMPLPGKQAGDEVTFDFDYFAPSRVLATQGGPLKGLLAGDEAIDIRSYTPR